MAWDRDTDTFELGHWLKGWVDVRRSDLSTDGRYFIFSAGTHGKKWTAVSIVPYLSAIVFDPNTWPGGGLFVDQKRYLLDRAPHKHLGRPILPDKEVHYAGTVGLDDWSALALYHQRLCRDGWTLVDADEAGRDYGSVDAAVAALDKPLPNGWTLRKITSTFPSIGHPLHDSSDEHQLLHAERGQCVDLPDWEWADWDRDRLVWAANGQLRTCRLGDAGPIEERSLHDFRGMVFEEIRAPYRGKRWRGNFYRGG